MNVFFDVQGTLLSSDRARPHVRSVLEELTQAGHHVYIWSGGGASYAKNAAYLLEVDDLVFGTFSKTADIPVTVDFAVDDFSGLVECYGGYTVATYYGASEDDALLEVPGAVKSHEEREI
ncbi:MAG: hypothetical protein ACR2KW_08405 [Rubrobacter sp.]